METLGRASSAHTVPPPLTAEVGLGFIVTEVVVLLQPDKVSVKVNVTLPAAIPVTRPALVMVAMVLSLLLQVPPVVGDNVMVAPTQSDVAGRLRLGKGFTVTVAFPFRLILQVPLFTETKFRVWSEIAPVTVTVAIPPVKVTVVFGALLRL